MEQRQCPFCDTQADTFYDGPERQYIYRNCLCGEFIIYRDVLDDRTYGEILENDKSKKMFSGYLRNNQVVKITNSFVTTELEDIYSFLDAMSLEEKILKLKNYLYKKTKSLGEKIAIEDKKIFTSFYISSPSELIHVLRYLDKVGIIKMPESWVGATVGVELTVEGFSNIETELNASAESKKVFIACKFDTEYQDKLVKTIKAACLHCGYDANLVSDERHNEDISHKIIADIKHAKFVIADFTDQNNGVYFEAGYAMGMGKEVIRLIVSGTDICPKTASKEVSQML